MSMLNEIGKRIVFFDGGFGTLLQKAGLKAGELPETWNIVNPQPVIDIHRPSRRGEKIQTISFDSFCGLSSFFFSWVVSLPTFTLSTIFFLHCQ